jgi:hypothetical protein
MWDGEHGRSCFNRNNEHSGKYIKNAVCTILVPPRHVLHTRTGRSTLHTPKPSRLLVKAVAPILILGILVASPVLPPVIILANLPSVSLLAIGLAALRRRLIESSNEVRRKVPDGPFLLQQFAHRLHNLRTRRTGAGCRHSVGQARDESRA